MYANGKSNKMSVTISSSRDPLGHTNCASNNGFKVKTPTISSSCVWPSDGGDFEFVPPPEAPIFRPTHEEFLKGPLEYISKIRQFAEPYGICKIIPPSNFQPPFAVDVEKFRFTPRVQRLNELEAQTRVKLNFLEQIIKYWDLQGTVRDKARGASLKIPTIEKKVLDLHVLHKVVQEEGGFEICTTERKWSRVAYKMGFFLTSQNKGTVSSLLRQHYERILYPYDVFLSGATVGPDDFIVNPQKSEENNNECNDFHENLALKTEKLESDVNECGSSESFDSNEKRPPKQPRRLARRMQGQQRPPITLQETSFQNKELKKLQVYGAGPKMPGFSADDDNSESKLKSTACYQCGEAQSLNQLLKCAGCKNLYHLYCLIPPLNDIPKGVWHCPRCVAYLVQSQPQPFTHEFGFMQSQRDYSLSEFGEMADQFKRDYFRMAPHSVPHPIVEKEFWRLVASMEDTVSVEYGADLHTNDYGSGFPTRNTANLISADADYIDHAWNLNNLPVIDGSVFKYINANISGMIVPWMYVGMCFSTFCWHNEDHWSYSINYLHWGEAKSWYGVPGDKAEAFENAMKQAAPELFESQPDLLHQLVTICNPNLLTKLGVPIYRTNQLAGEFVVTFPRSYHAGFNQGLNFAEAVNFAPAEWVVLGRQCMQHYSQLHRYPVFSHDELICKMACDPDILDVSIAVATYNDMLEMVELEKQSRLQLLNWGVTLTQRLAFEVLPDDERQCEICRTTCFLSAVTCVCSQEKLVCILHRGSLCKNCLPSNHTLRYRFTLDELRALLQGIKKRIDAHAKWLESVKQGFDRASNTKPTLRTFKALSEEAVSKRFPINSKIYKQLKSAIEEAEKASKAAKELLEQQAKVDEVNNLKKVKQEYQETVSSARLKKKAEKPDVPTASKLKSLQRPPPKSEKDVINDNLTLEELSLFHEEIDSYACTIPESLPIKQLFDRCVSVSEKIMETLKTFSSENIGKIPSIFTSEYLEGVVEEAKSIAVVSFGKQLEKFKQRLHEVQWFEDCNQVLSAITEDETKEMIDLEMFKSLISIGYSLTPSNDAIRKALSDLQQAIENVIQWREKRASEAEEKARNPPCEEQAEEKAVPGAKRKKEECVNRKKKEESNLDRKKPKLEKLEKRKTKRSRNEKDGSRNGKYELCSMSEKCLKPSAAEVNWVFCEGVCQGWFHQLCAGIQSPDEIAHLEKYYCVLCRQSKNGDNDGNLPDSDVEEPEEV